MGLLSGKRALVLGIANERSLAHAIARKLADEGATLALTYQGEALEERVRGLAEPLRAALVLPCDVGKDEDIDRLFGVVGKEFGGLDILVHAIAFAGREALTGPYYGVTRAAFAQAMDVSVYSFTALARGAAPFMTQGGALLTLTYYGSEKVVRNYNVMGVAKAALESSVRYLASDLGPKGIRVNAISAGPINTLAARGIAGFTRILDHYPTRSPMKRNVEPREVADTALFLASHLSSGITGEVIYVDCGYHVMGM